MKHITKILALALALIMVLGLATTAFAADIVVDDKDVEGAEYAAYKLLNLTTSLKAEENHPECGGEHTEDCYNYAYTVNEKYRVAMQTALVDTDATDDEIIDAISNMDAEAIRDFADDVFAQLEGVPADYTTNTNTFAGVDQGYYLIVETETGSAEGFDEDTYSLVILDTAGQDEVKIETKEELPTSQKKVKDANDTEGTVTDWQDSADHDIGDEVPFQIIFTLPSDFAEYEEYFVGIHDVQAEGLTYNNDLVVTVNGNEELDLTNAFTYTEIDAENTCAKENSKCTFHIQCADIIAAATAAGITLKADDQIVFEYTSTLNENTKLGATGNPNEMTIEFSNNPYGDGTSETPKDRVIVFTFKVNVNKYTTIDEQEVALSGAGFTLYKEVKTQTADAKTGAEIKADLAKENPAIKAGALKDEAYYEIADVVEVDATGAIFGFKGIDDGNYVLVETTIPEGYNAWNAEAFTITAAHDVESADPQLTSLTGGDMFTGEVSTGILSGKVENKSGTELPETGGIGTTIFYIVGGMLAVAAVVLLITKKRMASAE